MGDDRRLSRTDLLIALAGIILIAVLQAKFGIDGMLSWLSGILLGAVAVYFGLSYKVAKEFGEVFDREAFDEQEGGESERAQ